MARTFQEFVYGTRFEDLSAEVVSIMRRSVLDTLGVATAGTATAISRIVSEFACQHWWAGPRGPRARLLFDGAFVSPAGAAVSGAFTIDSIDAHDGYSAAKGHAGSAILPAVLAFSDDMTIRDKAPTGQDFLTVLAVGYEVAYRAGLALHATTADYHTSGAWTAVGAAAVGARLLKLNGEQLRHAVGIAEYHGSRSQMMRCIDHPTMPRDGVGWGSPTGVSAAYMAALGFTGAPAITVESGAASSFWSDLGERWEILGTHYKRYPVCRWAHPSIDAARELIEAHQLKSSEIERVRIQTFHYATRLACRDPKTADEVIYGIAYPTAIMIVRGRIGLEELSADVLNDPEIKRISLATELVETDHYTRISTRQRWADVALFLKDGRFVQSEPRTPKGDPEDPLSDKEIRAKFHLFADGILGSARADAIELAVSDIDKPGTRLEWLGDLVYSPTTAMAA